MDVVGVEWRDRFKKEKNEKTKKKTTYEKR